VIDVVCASSDCMSQEITAYGMADLSRVVRKRAKWVVDLWPPSKEEAAERQQEKSGEGSDHESHTCPRKRYINPCIGLDRP